MKRNFRVGLGLATLTTFTLLTTACDESPTGPQDVDAISATALAEASTQSVTGEAIGVVNAVFPSTNADNLANGWARVVLVEATSNSVTLDFVSERGFASCFEYRVDDEAPTGDPNFNPALDDLWEFTCRNNSTGEVAFPATQYVDVRSTFGAEADERFDWTRFHVLPDEESPVTSALAATPNPAAIGASYDVTALVDDSNTGGSAITGAEYAIDGSAWTAMNAVDGAYDDATEAVEALGLVAPTEPGLYQLCVRGTDAGGNTGEASCTQLVVYDPSGGFVTGGGWITSPEGAMNSTTAVWSQDFSADAAGWFGSIVASGGTAVATGDGDAVFSRFDGYRDVWPGTYSAEIDVYLDPAWATGEGFDYSVASNGADGNHQRDFIFHVGVVEDYGPVVGKALLVNGSNNADFATSPYKLVNDNGGSFYEVTTAGWYTLQHAFRDAGGYLAVDLNLLDAGGNVLWTATRENPADLIPAEVGGNRYSWFTHIDVTGGIEVDNHELFIDELSAEGRANFGFVSRYKKGAQTPDGNTQFTFQAGDVDFHSTSYDWLVVNQGGENAQFKGEGTINGQGSYRFMLWAGDHDTGDTFRIKIWEEVDGAEQVVYDNGTDQPIGGGNIVVHDGKGKKN